MPAMGVQDFLIQFLYGLSIGSVYGLMASGLSIIFGLMDVIHFSHGAFYAIGCYIAITVMQILGLPFWLAAVVGCAGTAAIGAGLERGLIRRLYGWDPAVTLIFCYGLSQVILDLIRIFHGTAYQNVALPSEMSGTFALLDVQFPQYRVFLIVIGAVIFFLMDRLLNRTTLGLQIRAGTQDREMTRALGIDIRKVFTITFAIGVGLAGLGGTLVAPITSVYPHFGVDTMVIAFAAIIIGGMGNFRGTIFASYICGLIATYTGWFLPKVTTMGIFVFMAIVCLMRPEGLFVLDRKGKLKKGVA